jgi:hypothetical protein
VIDKGLFYRCGAEKLLLLESLLAFFKSSQQRMAVFGAFRQAQGPQEMAAFKP